MSVSSIQTEIQSNEQYKIRKQNQAQQAEELQQEIKQAEQVSQEVQQIDEYDKNNPVGEEVEGIYSLSHDEAGNLKVDYKQPTSKNETAKSENMSLKANEETSKSDGAKVGTPTASQSSEESSDDDDEEEELEKLKQQRDNLRQQLNRESDENLKASLRAELQSIEMQIALKSSGSIN